MSKDTNEYQTIRIPKELNDAVKIAAIKKNITKEELTVKFIRAGLKRIK